MSPTEKAGKAMATHSSTLAWNHMDRGAWWAAVHGVRKSWTQLSDFTFTFHFHALEKEMATHSSVLAWRIPGTGEPGGLPSMGLQSRTRLKRLSSSSSSINECNWCSTCASHQSRSHQLFTGIHSIRGWLYTHPRWYLYVERHLSGIMK